MVVQHNVVHCGNLSLQARGVEGTSKWIKLSVSDGCACVNTGIDCHIDSRIVFLATESELIDHIEH